MLGYSHLQINQNSKQERRDPRGLKTGKKFQNKLPWRSEETEPLIENSKIRCRSWSIQQPNSAETFGWWTWPMVPSSVRKSFTFCSSLEALISLFTAITSPFLSTPLKTSAYPPLPTKFSVTIPSKLMTIQMFWPQNSDGFSFLQPH